jgi:hypothetical protein
MRGRKYIQVQVLKTKRRKTQVAEAETNLSVTTEYHPQTPNRSSGMQHRYLVILSGPEAQ